MRFNRVIKARGPAKPGHAVWRISHSSLPHIQSCRAGAWTTESEEKNRAGGKDATNESANVSDAETGWSTLHA